MRLVIVLIFTFVFSVFLKGQNDPYLEAEQAFENKDYSSSIKIYEGLIQEHKSDASLLFNLANSYQAKGDIAKAIYYYESALIYKPGAHDILYNLSIANDNVDNPITEINNFFLSQWYWNVVHQFKSTTIFIWTLVFIIWFLLFLYFLLFKEISFLQKYKWFIGTILLVIIFIHYSFFSSRVHIESGSHAIIMKQTEMRSGADERSQHLHDVDPGVKAAVMDSIQTWYKISLPDKEQGWIKKEQVRVIK